MKEKKKGPLLQNLSFKDKPYGSVTFQLASCQIFIKKLGAGDFVFPGN